MDNTDALKSLQRDLIRARAEARGWEVRARLAREEARRVREKLREAQAAADAGRNVTGGGGEA